MPKAAFFSGLALFLVLVFLIPFFLSAGFDSQNGCLCFYAELANLVLPTFFTLVPLDKLFASSSSRSYRIPGFFREKSRRDSSWRTPNVFLDILRTALGSFYGEAISPHKRRARRDYVPMVPISDVFGVSPPPLFLSRIIPCIFPPPSFL